MPGKKKKKGGKDKGSKNGGEGKLPPPPKLDEERQGAVEALLKFKISGKEDMVDLYQEEAEVFKEKNYHNKERNYQLRLQQEVHYKTLVQSAKQYEEELDKAEVVERDRVDEALAEKLELQRKFAQQLRDMEGHIVELDGYLEIEQAELDRWTYFHDKTQHRNAEYIAAMEQQMKDMEREEEELINELEAKLKTAKIEITKKSEAFAEKQREIISSKLLGSMDNSSLGEMKDNTWLHKQIEEAKKALKKIKSEADAMELRNLGLMEVVTAAQLEEAEITKELMQSSTRKGSSRTRGAGSTSELPSLVDVAKYTSDEGDKGQAGQMEMKLLAVQGSKAPFNFPPDTFHLPPIEEQRSAHTALPPRTNWPISYSMLKSVV